LVLAWVVLGRRLFERPAVRLALVFATPYLLALPFAVASVSQATGSGWFQLVVGWQTAPLDDGPLAVLFFYLTNLGLPFALAIAGLVLVRTPGRAFLAVWMAALFVIPNLVQVSYVSFDMNKIFQAMWIATAIAAAMLVARWPRPAIAAVFIVSAISPALSSVHHAFSQNFLMSRDDLAAADWIADHTAEGSVFVTDDWIISPTDPAGRLRLTTFGPYVANLGFDPTTRQRLIDQIRCGGDPALSADLMRSLRATYIFPSNAADCADPVDFGASPLFDQVYANRSVTIYRLSSEP
jgi:hypothetical protein